MEVSDKSFTSWRFLPRNRWLIALLVVIAYAVLLWQVSGFVRHRVQQEMLVSGERQLNIYVNNLQAQLEKYEFLPELLSTNAPLVELLKRPGDSQRIDALNRYLETINTITHASDTYLMDNQGLTIAASNWQSEKPFVGRNFSYRPYFKQAMQGQLGRYYALGSTSGRRGYYFAYPVRHEGGILGTVVIKIDLTKLEQQWQGRDTEVIVTDPEGVIFITTRAGWRFRSLSALSPEERQRILESRRYSGAAVEPLDVAYREQLSDSAQWIEISGQKRRRAESYLMLAQPMPEAGWLVHLLIPMKEVKQEVLDAIGASSVAFTVLLLIGLVMSQRYRRNRERALYEAEVNQSLREARDRLEQRVQERTVDLHQEIEERRRIQEALQETRDELIQAAKLAMLGQMSASISHEVNQPLAAIRTYTDNARLLLEQERCADVSWNLEQISELIETMTQISSQLKLFARKSDGSRRPVSVHNVIESSKRILNPQLRKSATEIEYKLAKQDPLVMADPVRLEQVLVNLIANAVNAMENQQSRWVSIEMVKQGGELKIDILDNGPGIPADHLERIFDPFFTTKESGLGLGLSISHHIIESMGGTLSAQNSEKAGALFTLRLPLAE
ncbi:MAG: ATP-binding protein [Candidatus Thiodiazotropha taylori]|nr:ATP-binding protein [Candidatus Thiodiazotropha taylori]